MRWQSLLRLHGTLDWLVVVVESDAKKKNKTNILPRTSIVDKIRNDFCNKQSDRWAVRGRGTFDVCRTEAGRLMGSVCACLCLTTSLSSAGSTPI